MFTQKFKITVLLSIATVLLGGLIANQVVEHKQIQMLQDQMSVKPNVVRVVVTPVATPTASPSATPKFIKFTPVVKTSVTPAK